MNGKQRHLQGNVWHPLSAPSAPFPGNVVSGAKILTEAEHFLQEAGWIPILILELEPINYLQI